MPCTCTPCCTDCCTVLRDNKYPFYVTSLMMLLFMSNQLDSEAPFTAFAGSIISSYFLPSLRGLGLAIFHWGVYVGLGVAFGLNMLVDALGWRWAYWIAGIPGVILGLLNLCTVKEPQKEITGYQKTPKEVQIQDSDEESPPEQPFCSVLFVVILCAAAMRCGGGYVFNYNISNYFHLYYPKFPYEHFMTWVPVAMGFCGALLGGVISDRAATRYGLTGRMVVFCISVFISIPLSIGVLYLDPPWCFIILMPNYLVIEMWGSIAMTASAEQAPRGRHTSAIAVYVFSINFFGGNLNLLVPPLKSIIGLRYTLMILYPGVYVLSFIFSLIAIPLAMKRQRKKTVGEISEEEEERRPLLS
ncbi:putative galactarate/D-glucarate transporter GudP [Glandiceps talaboti]